MKRLLFRAVALASLLLAAGIGWLSARSGGTRDNAWWCRAPGARLWWGESVNGQLAVRTAAPWPAAMRRRSACPTALDIYTATGEGNRPVIGVTYLGQPPLANGAHSRGWESPGWRIRARVGRVYTSETGMLDATWTVPSPTANLRFHELLVPHWMVALVAGMPALAWGVAQVPAILRKRRSRRGLCARCGYDLTGNVSGVCPECGQASARAAPAPAAAGADSISASAGDTVETAAPR